MHRVAGGGGVKHVGGGDQAQRLALGAVQVFAQVFDAGVVKRVGGVVREHAFFVVVVFVARDIRRHAGRRVGDHRVERRGFHHACDRKSVHGQRRNHFALGIAASHDARCGALRGAHAVAQQNDDVFHLLRAGHQRHDLEVAGGRHSLAVALRGGDGELVHAGLVHADGTRRGQGSVGRHALEAGRLADFERHVGVYRFAVNREACAGDGLAGFVRAHRGLQIKALTGQKAGYHRRGLTAGEELAGWRQAGNGGRGVGGKGKSAQGQWAKALQAG